MDLTAMLGASFVGAFLYAFTMKWYGFFGHIQSPHHAHNARNETASLRGAFAFHPEEGTGQRAGYFRWSTSLCRRYCAFCRRLECLERTSTRWNLKSKDGAASFKTEGYGFLSIHFAAYYGTRSDCSNSCYWHNTAVQLFQSGRHNSCNSCCSRCDLALLPLWGQSQSSCWSCRSRCFSSYFCLHFDLPWCGSLLAGLY